jgi:hypothetical protein
MGGPLVLFPRDALQLWTGAYGPDGEDDVEEEETDYWWVGEEVEGYADAVEVRGVSALILANGNAPTTFVPAHRLLLQQITWDPTADVVANALRPFGSIRWQHETTWVSQGPSYLFRRRCLRRPRRPGRPPRHRPRTRPLHRPVRVHRIGRGSGVRAGPDAAHTDSPGATEGSLRATVESDGMAGASGLVTDALAGLDP